VTIEPAAGGESKVTVKGTGADGSPINISYNYTLDGKDHPITGSQDFDTVALKRSGTTIEGVRKKAGKEVQTYTRVVSKDGKTMTVTIKGTNAEGQPVNNVVVFEKK
jgi:glycerate-2-kinase